MMKDYLSKVIDMQEKYVNLDLAWEILEGGPHNFAFSGGSFDNLANE